MQSPSSPDEDRSGDFEGGGWAAPFWQDVMEQVQREAMNEPYDMLFGRKTYQLLPVTGRKRRTAALPA